MLISHHITKQKTISSNLMKHIVYILTLGVLIFLFSCKQNEKEEVSHIEKGESMPNPEEHITNKLLVTDNEKTCNFDKMLSDSKTPKLAIKLFNSHPEYSEEPLSYFAYLKNSDKETREFYFRVLTNSYKIADGALAEGLGNLGKEFIENNPHEFAEFFDNKSCFSDIDLNTWAKIALLEFEIIDENIDTGKGESLVDRYCKKLIIDSSQYSESQKETIKKFCDFLKTEWGNFLKQID